MARAWAWLRVLFGKHEIKIGDPVFTKSFFKDLLERALKTAAQFTIGGLALGEGVDAFAVDWQLGLGFAVTGFVLSALTSIASAGIGTKGDASLVK